MRFALLYLVPAWVNYDSQGYYFRNAYNVFEQREGICAEQALLLVTLERLVGLDSKFAIPTNIKGTQPYEHGLAVVKLLNSQLIINEPCGRFNVGKNQHISIDDDKLQKRFTEWRKGNFKSYFTY